MIEKNSVVVDTNLLLDDPKVLYKLASKYEKIIIPLTVLKELDKLKFKPDTAFSAREAIRTLREFKSVEIDKIHFDFRSKDVEFDETNDAKIIKSAEEHGADIATKDVSMQIIAEARGLKTILYNVVMNNLFCPYVYIEQSVLFNNKNNFGYERTFEKEDYEEVLKLFETSSEKELFRNAWFFVIINASSKTPTVYANNPIKKVLNKIDDNPEYREIIIDKGTKVKALDIYQVCAIYALKSAPNTLLCGSYGSGKSLLATAYALATNNKKTFISRPNIAVDKKFSLGFLPGDLSEKLVPWMGGILSALYYIFSDTRAQINKDVAYNTYDFVKDTVFKKYFEMLSIETIQGISFMKDDILILDESQLCSISVLSTILSRFGKGSKLIATGDIKQMYDTIKPSESGLLKLLRLLPNENLAYVKLKNNYRSGLLELADKLQSSDVF